ncbi:MAG TPA: hypothetical protein VFD22_12675, partial [Gemmatimonadaceae bacterium]|nr:hypothetical protein [Gemmatimonadaceae bacterium]
PVASAGATAILLGTVASPGIANRTLAEGYLTQPMVMAMMASPGGHFVADLTLNFEGATLKRGELNAGVHGEGYVDRRHPHTLLHELVGTGLFAAGAAKFSVTAGKGFVPFGTDDPMSRPFVKYPVNHHLAQLLERAFASGAVASGPIILEGSFFNGDEPTGPYDLPNYDRIGDSWSARVTARTKGIEVQSSYAKVMSPELATGGLNHHKWSASARYEGSGRYALAEWGRTREGEGNATSFIFRSILAEGSVDFRKLTFAARAERSERPEHERDLNAFRTPQPHSDLSILGRTRWDILSVSLAAPLPSYRKINFSSFVEVSTQKPTSLTTPSAFNPADFYGASRLWSFSFGARVGVGMKHSRMGRYGVAVSKNMEEPMKGMDM